MVVFSLFTPSVGIATSDPTSVSQKNENENQLEKEREKEYFAETTDGLNQDTTEVASLLSGLDWQPSINDGNIPKKKESIGKVEATVHEVLKKEKMVDVIVKLKDQPNYNSIQKEAKKKQKKSEQAAYVISQLEAKAQASQKGLKQELASLEKKGKAKVNNSFWINNSMAVTVDNEALGDLEKREDIERISLDQVIQVPEVTVESKPRLPEWGLEKINATRVWGNYGIKGEGIVVGIMDTGVDGKHEALKNNYRGKNGNEQYSWIDLSGHNYKTPSDGNGHGTHVAGSAVGGGEGEPIGVAPGAEWIAAKIFNDGGSTTTSTIHAAFEWFMAPGGDPSKAPHVVNNSWGNANTYNTEFANDVKAWVAAGIVPLFAAGNEGPGSQTVGSPGSFLDSFTIGATDRYDQVASFSSRGPVYWENDNGELVRHIKPDVTAPGHQIYSAWPTALGKGKYHTISGTSMATPHATGAVALLLSANPNMSIDEIVTLMKRTARTEPHMGTLPNDQYGTGIINIYRAVTESVYAGELTGRVTDQTGNPLKAEIEIVGEKINFNSNSDGFFEYKIREGIYQAKVKAFGFKDIEAEVKIVKSAKTEVSWKMEQATVYNINGVVIDEKSGEPIPFAYLRLKGTPLGSIRTNLNGEFHIEKVPAGNYELQITGEGIKGHLETISLQNNQTINIEVNQTQAIGNSDWKTANNNASRNAVSPNSIDLENIEKGWNYVTGTKGEIVFSTPAVAEQQMIVVTDRGWVISIDTQTGYENWAVRLGLTNRSSPTIEGGMVYVSGGQDGTIYALELKTGKTVWSRNLGQPTVYESPLYKDGTIFVGSGLTNNASLFALNAQTGAVIWKKELGSDSYFGPTLGDQYIYIGTYQNRTIQAIDPKNGAEVWKQTVTGEGFATKSVYHNGTIYTNSYNFDTEAGTLRAFDAATGQMKWSTSGIGEAQAASPIVYEDLVVMSSAKQPILRAFDRETGKLVWENQRVGSSYNNGSISANGLLFVSGTSGYLYIVDIYTGEVLKDFALPDFSYSGIPITSGAVFVPHRKGVQSFKAEGVLQGTVTDSSGKPTAGTLTVIETGESIAVDEKGQFKISHIPGKYTVLVSSYGKKQIMEPIRFVSGLTINRDFQLANASEGSLQVTVKDKRTNTVLKDVNVKIENTPISGTTNVDGVFTADSIFEGTYNLSIQLNGYELKRDIIHIKPGELFRLEVELQPFDIAVLNDLDGEVTSFLHQNGYAAEERDWGIIEDISRYKIIYLNGAYRSGGWQPDEKTFNQLIKAAKEHDVHLIFVDTWGATYGTIEQLQKFNQDPKELAHYTGRGTVQMKVDVEHPIFKGYKKGDTLTLYNRVGDFAWFNQYSGKSLATISNTEIGEKGMGVAFKPVSEKSAHVLLASHGASPWISPLQGWLPDMQNILFNTIDYLKNAKYGKLTGRILNPAGEPIPSDVEIIETNSGVKTSGANQSFELFHDEGDYTLEIRSLGYQTKKIPVTVRAGAPVIQTIVLSPTEGGMVSGTVSEANKNSKLSGATLKLLSEGQVVAEVNAGSNGYFEFINVQDGNYVLRTEATGYLFDEQEVRVRGEAIEISVVLDPIPKVAVLYDSTSANKNFTSVMSERGISVTKLTVTDVVTRIAEFDVVFFNEMSTTNIKKDKFLEIQAAADQAGTSMIFGDTYYSDAPINQLSAYRGDPKVRATVAKDSLRQAGYIVEKEHPIFKGAKQGDFIGILNASGSAIGYFKDYSGYPLAMIAHEGKASYGSGVAFKPRTANSLELLMSGHSFGLAHYADSYTKAGKQMMINAVIWASQTKFPTISGKVTDHEGNPLEADIKVNGQPYETKSNKETGQFEVAMLEGDYEIQISAFGYRTVTLPTKASFNGDQLDISMVPDAEVGSISGTIEDEKDGNALEGVSVNVKGVKRSTATNTQGSFKIDLLLPGKYQLSFAKEGYVFKEVDVVVKANEASNLAFKLKPSPMVGIIVDNNYNSYSLALYLQQRGYKTMNLFYTDLDKLDQVDVIIANSDYDNTKIPSKEVFTAFQKALDRAEKSILWTGHVNGRGGIRFMVDYEKNPAKEGKITKAGVKGRVLSTHPLTEGVDLDKLFEFTTPSNEYYFFDGYNGTNLVQLEHPDVGTIGNMVAYNGRTIKSVEVLLANMTFSYNFNNGPTGNLDPVRERLLSNALTFALDNKEALVGEVHGQVINHLGLPVLATVTVQETGKIVQTDAKGDFYLGLNEGTYMLDVKAFGHLDQQFEIQVKKGVSSQRVFEIEAEKSGIIKGRVIDGKTDEPISGAAVTILGTPLYTVTDQDGRYEMSVPVGQYHLRVSVLGYAAKMEPIDIVEGQEINLLFNMPVSEKIAFLGTTANYNRVAPFLQVEGYEVDFVDNTKYAALEENMKDYKVIIFNNKASSMTNDAFRAFVEKANANHVSIIFASQYGGGTISELVKVYGDPQSLTYNFVSEKINVKVLHDHPLFTGINGNEFTLLDKGKNTLNQQYAVYTGYSGTTIGSIAHADKGVLGDGIGYKFTSANSVHILLSSMEVGSYAIPNENWTPEAKRFYTNAIDWAISASIGEIRGVVKDENGKPIVNADVSVAALNQTVKTNGKGEYRIGAGTGRYEVKVEARGYHSQVQSGEITEQGQEIELNFTLAAIDGKTLTGTILHKQLNKTITGANVKLKEKGKLLEETVSDETGTFQFTQLLPGDYEVEVTAEGFLPTVQKITVGEDSTSVTIGLDAIRAAVIGDWNQKLVTFLNNHDLYAEATDWNVLDRLKAYEVIIVNTNKGTKEQMEQLIKMTDDNQISVVFLGTWGNDGSIGLLEKTIGYPKLHHQGYNEGPIEIARLENHPIFESLPESITIHSENSPYATFADYPGKSLAHIEVDGENKGAAIAYDFRTNESMHMLLSSFAVNNMIGPGYGWTKDGETLFIQSIRFAIDAKRENPEEPALPNVPVWDQDNIHTTDRPVKLTGYADPNTTVYIYDRKGSQPTLLGKVKTRENGIFTIKLSLNNGSYFLVAKAENEMGQSDFSKELHVVVSGKGN
jgi:subtilisin family serine protease/outer membrane protein assembly factor BamB